MYADQKFENCKLQYDFKSFHLVYSQKLMSNFGRSTERKCHHVVEPFFFIRYAVITLYRLVSKVRVLRVYEP